VIAVAKKKRGLNVNIPVFHEAPPPEAKSVGLAGQALSQDVRAADDLEAQKQRLNAAARAYNQVYAQHPIAGTIIGFATGLKPWRPPRRGRR
jgi:hypothetical protein